VFLALIVLEHLATPDFDVMHRGQPISSLPCNQGVVVTNVHQNPPAEVIFRSGSAELLFAGETDEERTHFVYVDGAKVALITAKGSVRMLVPLDQRAHHKIVTGGINDAGLVRSAMSECN
jgi:hypothetical protein